MPRAKAQKGGAAEAAGPSKAWLDSYADAMTLLLAFFILLYASSILDEDRFIDFKIGVAQALGKPSPAIDGGVGVLDTGNGVSSLIAAAPVQAEGEGGESPEVLEDDFDRVTEVTRDNKAELVEELEEQIEAVGAGEFVEVVDDPRGVIIRFDTQVLFRSGQARVLPDGVLVLTQVAGVLDQLDNLLVVEGHSDNVPTSGTEWPSNWELSTTRATNVLRFLSEVQGIPAVRLSAAGYADTRPRATNTTPEGRAENRRVEIVVVIDPFGEELIALDIEGPGATDFGAGVEDPAAPRLVPDNLLDLDPEPVQADG